VQSTGAKRAGNCSVRLGALVAAAVAVGLAVTAAPWRAASAAAEVGTSGPASAPPSSSTAVGLRVLRLVDTSRTIRTRRGRPIPRTLVTYVRYPALGAPGQTDAPNAPAAGGSYPLIVFAHGFDVTPQTYARLLQSWARAGFVVAAPVFPLSSSGAPGGPEEGDVVNQPQDVSFVISSLLALNEPGAGQLAGLIDPSKIAVSGHSDGAETALAVAYSRRYHDPRVDAAMIFSGAEMSGIGGYSFPPGGPPLLAVQGTADTSNEPRYTDAYFDLAQRPRFLLRLLGAGHLPPFTYEQPQLTIVEQVTVAFLERYLKGEPAALQRMTALGTVSRRSALLAEP